MHSHRVSLPEVQFLKIVPESEEHMLQTHFKDSSDSTVFVDNCPSRLLRWRQLLDIKHKELLVSVRNPYHVQQTDNDLTTIDHFKELSSLTCFPDLEFPGDKFKVDVFGKFSSCETPLWNSMLTGDLPLTLEDMRVIHGKRIGRTIGIPTGPLRSQSKSLGHTPGGSPVAGNIHWCPPVQRVDQCITEGFRGESVGVYHQSGVQPSVSTEVAQSRNLRRRCWSWRILGLRSSTGQRWI